MANIIDIVLKGVDQASGTVANVNRELGNLEGKAKTTGVSLSSLGKVVGALGLGALAVQAGRAFIELGQMGEQSAQLEEKFTALAGGAATARDRFAEMDAAVGNWLSRDAKMETSMRIMSLGLADSATSAAELAKTAITLGDSTQTAEQRIQSFTQMLATGQTRGLANFGISVIDVRKRVDELTAADKALSTEMATQQAITEAAAERMQLLGDYMPITETEQMANVAADFKDTLGDLVREPYIVSVTFLTEGLKNIQAAIDVGSDDPEQQLSGINRQLQEARENLERMQAASGKGLLGGGSVLDSLTGKAFNANQVAAQQKVVDDLIAKQSYLKGVTAETGDAGVAALDRQSASAVLLKDNLQKVEDKLFALEDKTKAPAAGDTTRTKVDAAGMVANLQKGLFGPEVIGAIDVDKLASEPGMAGLARKSFEAFGKALTANQGAGVNVSEILLGIGVDTKGQTPADTAAQKAVNALSAAIGAQVKGEDFAGKMIGYGETIWGYTETGMLNKAKSSTAFQAAIDAMVAAAIAGALQ